MAFFDDFLAKHVKDEADRAVLAKYPEVRTELDKMADRDAANSAWLRDNYDFSQKKPYEVIKLEAELEETKDKLAAAPAGGNTEMTFEEMENGLKAKGLLVDGKAINDRLQQFDQRLGNTDVGILKFYADVADLPFKHREEFGEPMDTEGFTKAYMANPNLGGKAVYESFTATKRAEKAQRQAVELEAKHKAEIETVRKEAADEARKSALMEYAQSGGSGIPVDQGRGPGNVGWLQKRSQDQRAAASTNAEGVQVPGGKLGDGTATNAMLEQYRKDLAAGLVH